MFEAQKSTVSHLEIEYDFWIRDFTKIILVCPLAGENEQNQKCVSLIIEPQTMIVLILADSHGPCTMLI